MGTIVEEYHSLLGELLKLLKSELSSSSGEHEQIASAVKIYEELTVILNQERERLKAIIKRYNLISLEHDVYYDPPILGYWENYQILKKMGITSQIVEYIAELDGVRPNVRNQIIRKLFS